MRLSIGSSSRISDRIQAERAADYLRAGFPQAEIKCLTCGEPPDLLRALRSGGIDVAVQSWKDRDPSPEARTVTAAVLPREDARDVIFIRKESWRQIADCARLTILTSSPRRRFNLESFASWAFPALIEKVAFQPLKGDLIERIREFFKGSAALAVAKAAVDRVLTSQSGEFADARAAVSRLVSECYWTVVPLSENPGAPGQGAAALRVLAERGEVIELVSRLSHQPSWEAVRRETEIAGSLSAPSCRSIGVSVLDTDFGRITMVRGEAGADTAYQDLRFEPAFPQPPLAGPQHIWPESAADQGFFKSRELDAKQPDFDGAGVRIGRALALPKHWRIPFSAVCWTAGLKSWRKLALRGVWVNGSTDMLGEDEGGGIDSLLPPGMRWFRLGYKGAPEMSGAEAVATYELIPQRVPKKLRGKTHFFWQSGAQFEAALSCFPEIAAGWHGCAPGSALVRLREQIKDPARVSVFLDYDGWRAAVLGIRPGK